MNDVVTTTTQNTRAAAMVLDQAEKAGLPDPISVVVGRGYDNKVSRNLPQIQLQFKTYDDLAAWATHLELEVVSGATIATNGAGSVASVWHHNAVADWMDVQLALAAVTEHAPRLLAAVQ